MIKSSITQELAKLLPNYRITFVSTYPPEHCGIAVFTKNLANALNVLNSQHLCQIIALQNTEEIVYAPEVKKIIERDNYKDYLKAAVYINRSKTNIVCLQHEFGIFGGNDGNYIIPFLKKIKKPKITILHSALSGFKKKRRELIKAISILSDLVVVLNPAVERRLIKKDRVLNKTVTIPLGVIDVPFGATEYFQIKLGFQKEEKIILSCGLISENKGLEYLIKSLPSVIAKFPSVRLLIIGETHPKVKEKEGETYREKLEKLVSRLAIEPQVKFINSFLNEEEFLTYIRAADIFCAPYLDKNQASSVTLSYAIGMGKACIATPYFYAKDVLGRGKGVLVPFKNEKAIAQAIIELFSNPTKKKKIERYCYQFARTRTWVNVGLRYLQLFKKVLDNFS